MLNLWLKLTVQSVKSSFPPPQHELYSSSTGKKYLRVFWDLLKIKMIIENEKKKTALLYQ